MDRGEAVTVQEGYTVRWIRKRPFLYKRAWSPKTTADGRPAFEDTFVGSLADDVAREWRGQATAHLPHPSPMPWPRQWLRSRPRGRPRHPRWKPPLLPGSHRRLGSRVAGAPP
jgi:hypothetical protein